MNGVLIINKEQGYTSHDVVARLRGIVKQRKIGHTGTLDPMAVGVLPVCLGNATRLCDMLTDKSKEYETCMLLGVSTDTQDTSGSIISENEVTLSEKEISLVINTFVGEYDQLPPMYSAIKVNGKKLYELAREGVEIERKTRRVCIDYIEDIRIELPRVYMRVGCSKGTYIRTLCNDIGNKLGCGAAMEQLTRTRVGGFVIDEAITLDEAEKLMKSGELDCKLIKTDDVFCEYDSLVSDSELVDKFLHNGNPVLFSNFSRNNTENEIVKMYDSCNKFIGIYRCDFLKNMYVPVKLFPEQ